MFKLESEAKYIMELSVQKVKEALETYSTSMGTDVWFISHSQEENRKMDVVL